MFLKISLLLPLPAAFKLQEGLSGTLPRGCRGGVDAENKDRLHDQHVHLQVCSRGSSVDSHGFQSRAGNLGGGGMSESLRAKV